MRRPGAAAALVTAAAFLGLAVAWGLASSAFQEADDVTHFAFSRWLFRYPANVLSIWGRPAITLYYALPAQLGPGAARVSSALLGAVVAWSAARLFRKGDGSYPAFAVACTLGMPFVFFQLYGILTELAFAALLGVGLVLYRDRRPRAAALVWSLLPLARPEGFFVGPLLAAAFLAARAAHSSRPWSLPRFACASLLATGLAAWWLAGLPVYRSPVWMIDEWPRTWRVASPYGDGHPLLFLAFLVIVTTPLLFPFFVLGGIRFWRRGLRLELVLVGFVVLLHGVLRTFGLFGSAGYPRYLVVLAPILGAVTARGVDGVVEGWVAARGRAAGRARTIVAAALAAVQLVTIALWPNSGPVHGDAVCQMLGRIWPWCAEQAAKNPGVRFVADHPFFYLLGDLDRVRHGMNFQPHQVEYADVGTIAIFESKFAGRYSGLKDPADLVALGFEPLPKEEVAGPGPYPWDGPRPRWADPELADFRWDVFVKRR
jgi:hypothetical protein